MVHTPSAALPRSVRWSVLAGVYALCWSLVLVAGTQPMPDTLGSFITPPTATPGLLLTAPVPFLGALSWYALVERPGRTTYPRGLAAGLLTAVLTNLFWMLRTAIVWKPLALEAAAVVVTFVLLGTSVVAVLAEAPFVYARRRLAD